MPFWTAGAAREGRAARANKFAVSCGSPRWGPCLQAALITAPLFLLAPGRAAAADVPADAGRTWSADAGAPTDAAAQHETQTGSADRPFADGGFANQTVSVRRRVPDERIPPHPPGDNQSVVRAHRMPVEAPREDRTASASVLIPADSPRARDDLGTLLLEVPGANVTRAGGLGSFAALSLRGANPDEVRIYVDGVPLNQAVGGAVDLSTLPLGDVERVEVYRGSTPMAFGQSALGGVVSISTRTPVGKQASIRLGAGSFRTTSADLTAGGSVGALRLYAGLHGLRAIGNFPDAPPAVSGGYQPSTRENTDLAQIDGVLRAALTLPGRRELRAGFIGVGRDRGLPAQNIFRSDARAATRRALAHLDYQSRDELGASSRLRAALFASSTEDEFMDRRQQIVGVPTAIRDRTRLLGVTTTVEKGIAAWARLCAMLEARGEDYRPRNQLDPVMPAGYPARRAVVTAGAELAVRSERLDLEVIPSLRLEASRDVRSGRDPLFGTDLPAAAPIDRLLPVLRLGLLRPLGGGFTARGNVGRYARIPSFVELYGYNLGIIGSPDLRPERGLNADIGLGVQRIAAGRVLSASVTAFGAVVEDLIVWQTYSGRARAENTSRARIWGVEAELRWRGPRFTLTTQGTFIDARDRGDIASRFDRQLEHRPRYRGYGRGEWRQPLANTTVALCGYLDVDGTAGNFRTTGPYSALPARLLVGAGLGVEHARTGMRLIASAFNLTDSRVEDFANYPLPGRALYLALAWSHVQSAAVP